MRANVPWPTLFNLTRKVTCIVRCEYLPRQAGSPSPCSGMTEFCSGSDIPVVFDVSLWQAEIPQASSSEPISKAVLKRLQNMVRVSAAFCPRAFAIGAHCAHEGVCRSCGYLSAWGRQQRTIYVLDIKHGVASSLTHIKNSEKCLSRRPSVRRRRRISY